MGRRPNILYLNSHDTGRFIQPMGHAVRTPHIQALADAGVLFRDCHNAGPTCSPSRAALLTGMLPHSCGMLGLAHRGFALTDQTWSLPHHLRSHGYRTAAWNMPTNHAMPVRGDEAAAASAFGYDTWLGHDLTTALEWLATPGEEPFFASLSWTLTHRIGSGFTAKPDPTQYDPRWTQPPPPLPDTPAVRADWAHFLCDIATWDAQVGLVLAALERSGRAADTIVVLTTDHGVPFPGMKCNPTVHGTGVLLVVRGPGGFAGGLAVDHLVSHLDLFPTLCAAAEVPVPERVQGLDLRPTLQGKPVRAEAHAEVTYHAAYEPWRSLRTKRHLYVRRFGERRVPVLPNCDESPSKDVRLAAGWASEQLPDEELYDLVRDPAESRNLVDDAAYAAHLRDLRSRLDTHMRATADPLLDGPVPLPGGCVTTHPDAPGPAAGVMVTAPRNGS